jgi:hypothetical protein
MVCCVGHGVIEGKGREGRQEESELEHSSQVGRHLLLDSNLLTTASAEALGRVLHPKWAILLGKTAGRLGIVLEMSRANDDATLSDQCDEGLLPPHSEL